MNPIWTIVGGLLRITCPLKILQGYTFSTMFRAGEFREAIFRKVQWCIDAPPRPARNNTLRSNKISLVLPEYWETPREAMELPRDNESESARIEDALSSSLTTFRAWNLYISHLNARTYEFSGVSLSWARYEYCSCKPQTLFTASTFPNTLFAQAMQ